MGASEYVSEQAALTIVVNGEAQVEYHRGKPLTAAQRAYLDRMDEQMSAAGISLGDASLTQPDALQRAQFVAMQLLDALQHGNDALIAAGCAYLASRLPDLTQVKARLLGGGFSAELVFNEPYVKEEVVRFTPRRLC
jgi:cellobiose-specific phosphotransferase system component IIA